MNLIANLQPAKQIMPAIGPFNDPTPGLKAGILLAFLFLLSTRLDMGNVAATFGRPTQLGIIVTLITAKMLSRFLLGRRSWNHYGVQGRPELLHVVPVGARNGHGQGDAVGVREEMSLGAEFASIGRVFANRVPPFTGAETMAPSSDWKRQSIPWRSS